MANKPEPKRIYQRHRPAVNVTLTWEAIELVNELTDASGLSRSAFIDQLIREEAERQGLSLGARARREARERRKFKR